MRLLAITTFLFVVISLVGSITAAAVSSQPQIESIVEPQDIQLTCRAKSSGCPSCPDGYIRGRIDGATKHCKPEEPAKYYLVRCQDAGSQCDECPTGWHHINRRYTNSIDRNGYNYCARD